MIPDTLFSSLAQVDDFNSTGEKLMGKKFIETVSVCFIMLFSKSESIGGLNALSKS